MPDNTIEVTLHLMANDEIRRLEQIATMLSTALGGSGKTSGTSPGEEPARTGTSSGGGALASTSPGQQPASTGRSRLPHHMAFLEGLPGGERITRGLDWLNGRSVDSEGNVIQVRRNPLISGAAQAVTYSALAPYAMGAIARPFNAVAGMMGDIANSPSATFGAGLGYGTGGYLGTPIGSAAFGYGFMQNVGGPLGATSPWSPGLGLHSPFSTPGSFLNPMFGAGSYMQAQQALQQFGWNANTPFGNQMQSSLMGLGQSMGTSGINALGGPSAVAEFLDPARYGGNSIQGLVSQLKLLGDAAMATNMNVGQLRQGLVQAAQTISSETGAPGQATNQQLLGLSFATGFGPSVTQGILGSQTLQNLAIAQNGGNIYQALYGPKAGAGVLGGLQMIIGQLTGTNSWAGLQAALNDPARKNGIMNRLAWIYRTNPQLLGGMRPDQIVQLANKGHLAGAYGFSTMLSTDQALLHSGHFNDQRMNQLLASAHGAGLSQSVIDHIRQTAGHGTSGHRYQDEISKLAKAVAQATGRSSTDAANRSYTQIDLTDRAARVLQKVVPSTSSANSNSGPPPWLSAAYPAPRR